MSYYRKCFEVIGYTYEADVHCIECAKNRFGTSDPTNPYLNITDNEGNSVYPIFLDSEWDSHPVCGDCLELLDWGGIPLEGG